MFKPLITIIHASARVQPSEAFPMGWREACRVARDRADDPGQIEYLLAVHESRDMVLHATAAEGTGWGHFEVIRYDGAATCVRGANVAAAKARGKLLVVLQDDMFPPGAWDLLLREAWAGSRLSECVIHVSSASPSGELAARNNELFNPQIITKARVDRLGYMGWPGYTSMFSDDEFSEHARRDGCVIDARTIVFEHRHPIFGEKSDAVYQDENQRQAYVQGHRLFTERAAAGFPGLVGARLPTWARNRPLVGICTPGQEFSNIWVDSWTRLFGSIILSGWNFVSRFGYSTAVHVSRMSMSEEMLKIEPRPDFILWIDDDNLLSFEQFQMLVADLEAAEKQDPNCGMVVGWCWMKCEDLDAERRVSCGLTDPEHGNVALPYDGMMEFSHDLITIDWSGFPVVLMRLSAIERAGGPGAFLPIIDPSTPWGCIYEDMAFCKRYREAGGIILVDRRVKVPHLKLQPAEPRGVAAAPVSVTVEKASELAPARSGARTDAAAT